jgi:CheY-like chemotaxis protein
MSIVKSLISLLSGEIQVQSEENKGTEINVRIPMRMCTSDDDEKGQAALGFERNIQTLRNRKLSVIIYGFPRIVRESLMNYLCDWYDCTLLEPTKDARPDIVLIEEGNEEVLEAARKTAQAYGMHAVLLSMVTSSSRLGKRMDTMDGYIKRERVPRHYGPNNVAKALLSCLEKLDDLRRYGKNASDDRHEPGVELQPRKRPANLQELKKSLPGEQYMSSLEKLQISEASQAPFPSSNSSKSSLGPSKSSTNEEKTAAIKQLVDKPMDQNVNQKLESSETLRILIVDDNYLNLRLLGAFFKKNGYRDVKQAKHGREAVEAVQNCSEGFDIIFMGT